MTAARGLIEASELDVHFPSRPNAAVTAFSATLAPGERVIVIGASGCGKSTVLAAFSGVVPHTWRANISGHVWVAGVDTAESSVVELSRTVTVVAQDPQASICLPGVDEELALALENRGVPPSEIGARIVSALEAVGAAALSGRSTAELSGGEAQRIALAAGLITRGEVLLLDEPTAMLDPAGIRAVVDALDRIEVEGGPAVVLVEHRLDEFASERGLAGLPGRMIVLGENGRIVADGPTVQVMREHAERLHADGCWLPLEAELTALSGLEGGLGSPAVCDWLLARMAVGRMASGPFVRSTFDAQPAETLLADTSLLDAPLLAAEFLSVGRGRGPSRVGRRRRRLARASAGTPEPVLRQLHFSVRRGEVVAVLGSNGIGKSTLLLTLAGLLPPREGDVLGARPGMIFQNPEHQFVAHTVRAEIGHGLAASQETTALVDGLLERMRLNHLAEQSPFRLSGGEKRRLSIAAMLAHDRPVLLADEPGHGLDRRDSLAMMALLREESARRAIIFSTHELRMVAALATRVIVLGAGGMLADNDPHAVFSDGNLLDAAGLRLPSLLRWLVPRVVDSDELRRVVTGLDGAAARIRPERAHAS